VASVTFEAVHKAYDDVEIIKGVDLTIEDGEFLVLVGPSGCGKSTMLRLVAGLETVTGGNLKIGDRIVNDVAPRDRGVAMVFQSYALYPHMTVRENMAFGLKIRKEPKEVIDPRIEEVARQLDIEPYLERYPKQLSGGQRQRVAIGRAIVRDPDVFLFDEPLSNLDAALRTQMRVELKKLHRRLATTMLYVTHDQIEAMTLASRIAILRDGLVQQVGTPDEVYNTPQNRFVASFIGSPSMNFLPVEHEGNNLIGPGIRVPWDGPTVVELGVRPQQLQLATHIPDGFGRIDAHVEVIEPMGWESYLHTRVGEHRLVAHVRTEEVSGLRPDSDVSFAVEPGIVHGFQADGACINPGHAAQGASS
jgi:multiple sugar transport system ATP-binding protein